MGIRTTLRGYEGRVRHLFEGVPNNIKSLQRGKGLQGHDIVAYVDRDARDHVIAIAADRMFMRDSYCVGLNPEDFEKLKQLRGHLEREILEQLERTRKELGAMTKCPFAIELIQDRAVSLGGIDVKSSCRASAERTTLVPSGQRDPDFSFQAEGFDEEDDDWEQLLPVLSLMREENYDQALALLNRLTSLAKGSRLGPLLTVLAHFLKGEFVVAMRLLNGNAALLQSEHGHYLRALAYAELGASSQANDCLELALRTGTNPMGCLIKGLIVQMTAHHQGAATLFQLAASDPIVSTVMQRHMPQTLAAHQVQTNLLVFRMHELTFGKVYHIAGPLPFGLSMKQSDDGTQAFVADYPTRADLVFYRKGKGLKVVASKARLNGLALPAEGATLEQHDRLSLGDGELVFQCPAHPGKLWDKRSERDFDQPCYLLSQERTRQTWVLPNQNVLILGRDARVGNDLCFPENSRMSGQGHCQLQWSGQRLTVTDLGSSNHTGKGIRVLNADQSAPLLSGELFTAGDTSFKVEMS